MVYAGLMFLNWTFHAVHVGIILINTFGWLFPGTQKAALTVQVLTLMSWFGLGCIYGFGYCCVTDWHSRIQRHLGQSGFPGGYIKFLVDRMTGMNADPVTTDRITAIVLLVAVSCSISKTLA
jgi:Protein of Unknown function (DUF2784)